MGLFDGLRNNRIQTREVGDGGNQQPGGRGVSTGGRIAYATTDNTSLMVAAVYRAISLRADTMSQLVMEYHKKSREGGNYTIDDSLRGKHLNYLLQVKPNDRMNWPTLMRQAEIRRVLKGNAYIYIERMLDGEVAALWLCQDAIYMPTENRYNVTYYIGNVVVVKSDVDANDVIHLRNTYSLDGGFTGVSTIRYASRVFNTAATQDELALDVAAKGGKKKLVIQEKEQQSMGFGKVAKSQMEVLENKLNESWFDKDVTYVSNTADIKDYSQTLQELQLIDSRKFTVREVARLFGVPAAMLMDDSNSSYKTPEAATLEFLSRTIAPLIREWECEFNAKILGEGLFGMYRFHLCEKPLFRLDRTGQAAWDKARMETGVVSINDLRAEQDLPRIENGDEHYVSTNLAIAGSEKLRGAAVSEEGGMK